MWLLMNRFQPCLGGVLLLPALARHHLGAPEVRHLDAHDREVRDVEMNKHRGEDVAREAGPEHPLVPIAAARAPVEDGVQELPEDCAQHHALDAVQVLHQGGARELAEQRRRGFRDRLRRCVRRALYTCDRDRLCRK